MWYEINRILISYLFFKQYFYIIKVFVIDSGKNKLSDYDPKKNLDVIQSEWVSLANARQRMGRAGRTQPGVCFRLYSRARESTFAAHPVPEIKRTRLEELILRIKILKLGKVAPFLQRVPEPPEERNVQLSLELLGKLGALDPLERLTPLGFHLAQLPTDPRTGKLILMGAIFGCLEPILNIAAALSFKDPFVISFHQRDIIRNRKKVLDRGLHSDHLLIAKLMIDFRSLNHQAARNYCNENYLNFNTMSMLMNMVDQFCRDLHERRFLSSPSVTHRSSNVNSGNERLIRSVLCAGLFPSIAQVKVKPGIHPHDRLPPKMIYTEEDGRVTIHPGSVNIDSIYKFQSSFLCYHGKTKTSEIFLYDCSEVPHLALLFFGGNGSSVSNQLSDGSVIIQLAAGIELLSDQPTVELSNLLRSQWEDYLSYRVSHPGPTDWSEGSPDSGLLRAILHFVTADEGSSAHLLPPRSENQSESASNDQENEPLNVKPENQKNPRCSSPEVWVIDSDSDIEIIEEEVKKDGRSSSPELFDVESDTEISKNGNENDQRTGGASGDIWDVESSTWWKGEENSPSIDDEGIWDVESNSWWKDQ